VKKYAVHKFERPNILKDIFTCDSDDVYVSIDSFVRKFEKLGYQNTVKTNSTHIVKCLYTFLKVNNLMYSYQIVELWYKYIEPMLGNSYTLKLDRQKLKNVREMSNYQSIIIKYEDQLKTDENQTKLTFRGYYNSLKSAKQAYVNAVNAANLAEKNAETSEKNLGLGTVSVMDHEGVLNAFSNAKAAEKNAYFEMYKAWITYNDAVAGVI